MLTIVKQRLNQIHSKLDWLLRRSEKVFEETIRKWFAFTTKQIQKDLATKFQKDIASELTDWEYLESQGREALKPTVLKVMQGGGGEAYKVFQVKDTFGILNPEAVKAADKFTAELVREVNQGTKEGIRAFISAGIKEGKSMDKIARGLRPLVGLTKNQTKSIIGYRILLQDKEKFPKLTSADIDKKVQRYADKTHRRRTKSIARTETARAQNLGYAQGMEDLGVEQLEFSVHPDEKLCPVCDSMDGKKYSTSKAGDVIPVHPNCRCAMLPVVANVSVCRGVVGEVEKGVCIPPDKLGSNQVDDLLKKLERTKDPSEGRKIRRALRRLGHRGGLVGKPPVVATPKIKPTVPVVPAKPKLLKPAKGVQTKWERSLSSDNKSALVEWGKGQHAYVHAVELNNPNFLPPYLNMKMAREINEDLVRAMKNAPPTKLKVFRGGIFDGIEFRRKDYVAGNVVKFRTTTSSTSSESIASKFVRSHSKKNMSGEDWRYLFEIQSKTAVDIRKLSGYKVEKELLLRKGTKYEVLKVTESKGVTRVVLKEIVGPSRIKPPVLPAVDYIK